MGSDRGSGLGSGSGSGSDYLMWQNDILALVP